jgi:4-hydroxybenzoate polyprenyltransferase
LFIRQALNNLIRQIRSLSLDIVAGALAVSFFFSSLFGSELPLLYWIALGFTVWLVYMVDHFADSYLPGSYNNKQEVIQLRSYRKLLGRLSILVALILIVITFLLPFKIVIFGLAGVLFMIGYTVLNQVQNYSVKAFFPREPVIALFYILGTAGIPLIYNPDIRSEHLIFILALFLLILTNTFIFACIDYEHDLRAGTKTIAIRTGPGLTRIIGIITCLTGSAILIWLSRIDALYSHSMVGLCMAAPLFLILLILKDSNKKYLAIFVDLVLLFPFVLLFL